jgi:GT2 family glycosyltransferase
MWGESDSLIPRQTFQILDNLQTAVKEKTPKYVTFFGTCKMWDDSWLPVEHTEFTDKPFVDGDTENWWSLRYNMTIDEMNKFNDKVEHLDIKTIHQYKLNGCGLVMSSDVVKAGVNIPNSSFFIHEDTAFMLQLQKMFQGVIPQYVIKNILLVHNRKHTKKRSYVLGEMKSDDVSGGRLRHDWYKRASEMSHHNAYNMFNQSKTYTWDDVFSDD